MVDPDNDWSNMEHGFTLLAARYVGGITQDDRAELGDVAASDMDWEDPALFSEIKGTHKILNNANSFFCHMGSWPVNMARLIHAAGAITFLTIMSKHFSDMGGPKTAGSAKGKKIMKNAVILFDRIMYDHLSGDWRSSWSMFKRYLKRYDERKTNRGMFSNDEWEHVSTKKWLALLDNALDNGTIAGKKYADSKDVNKRISTLLVYTQMIQSESTAWIYGSKSYQIDHIIPKKKPGQDQPLFTASCIPCGFS